MNMVYTSCIRSSERLKTEDLRYWKLSDAINFIACYPSAQSPCQNEGFVDTSRKLFEKKMELFLHCIISHGS